MVPGLGIWKDRCVLQRVSGKRLICRGFGRLKASPWVRKDGQVQAGLECVADSVEFGPRRAEKFHSGSDPIAPDSVDQSPLMDVLTADSMAAH